MKSRQKKYASMNHRGVNRRTTRSMSLANGRENSLPIPIDIIIMIFSRLNLKSIARCRCVSKLWSTILCRSDFTELFLSMSCSRGPNLLFAFHNKSKLFFSSPHPQNSAKNLSRVVINYEIKFSIGFSSYFENSDLVNGLIYLKDGRVLNGKRKTVPMICNPSTGQTLILPEVKTSSYCMWSLFGYDPIDKQFKVLVMKERGKDDEMCDEFQVLTLESGNMSWKMIDCCIPHYPPHEKICINGVLYYTSKGDWPSKDCEIVCFDIRSEKFTFIKVMGTLKEAVLEKGNNLINYNGKLGLLQWDRDNLDYGHFDGICTSFRLWVLEDLEKQEWSDHTFVFSDVPEIICEIEILRIVGVTKKNEIVLWSKYPNNPFYVFYLNLEEKTIKMVEIQGMDVEKVANIFIDHVEDVKLYPNV